MSTPLSPAGLDRDFACVDLETTGGNASWHRIIEIGVVEVDRDGTRREWSTLVNPGTRIPPLIEAFTGISNEMVVDAPAFEDVRRELLERLAGRVFVAHNARFDYGFIRAELGRLDLSYSARVLCTVKLSRRLFPAERHHNLDSVMARHGLDCSARHRALGDARVLADLLAKLADEVGRVRVGEAVDALLQETPLPAQLPPGLADELPELAGVYRFHGEGDALLYVGKSKNIRKRVLEHFAAGQRSAAGQRLATQVRRVDWTETAGELGALLIEARAVKSDQPLHNRRLRAGGAVWTLRLAPVAGAPSRLEATELDTLDEVARADVYGLYRDRRAATRAVEEIVRAHQLCARGLGVERGGGGGGVMRRAVRASPSRWDAAGAPASAARRPHCTTSARGSRSLRCGCGRGRTRAGSSSRSGTGAARRTCTCWMAGGTSARCGRRPTPPASTGTRCRSIQTYTVS